MVLVLRTASGGRYSANPTCADRHNRVDDRRSGRCLSLHRGKRIVPTLLAFGGDSAIELFSAVVVLWRFRESGEHEHAERWAARVAGALLIALAAFVAEVFGHESAGL